MYDPLELIALALISAFMLIGLLHASRAYQRPRLWRPHESPVSSLMEIA